MGIADLIIGKAGPNTIFETVAAKKPFIAITHIAGQEDCNLDLIKEYQLGFVEENAIKVVEALARCVEETHPFDQVGASNRSAGRSQSRRIEKTVGNSRAFVVTTLFPQSPPVQSDW